VIISPIDAEDPGLETAFDTDRAVAVRTRKATIATLVAQQALVCASHLPASGVGRPVSRPGGGIGWQPA
jgi:hypothetical protein